MQQLQIFSYESYNWDKGGQGSCAARHTLSEGVFR